MPCAWHCDDAAVQHGWICGRREQMAYVALKENSPIARGVKRCFLSCRPQICPWCAALGQLRTLKGMFFSLALISYVK